MELQQKNASIRVPTNAWRRQVKMFRLPIPFGRWYRHRFLPRTLSKRFELKVIECGSVTFCALDCSPAELHTIESVRQTQLSKCWEQLASWCKPNKGLPRVRVCCLGTSAPLDHLGRGLASYLAQRIVMGCWDNETRSVFLALNSEFPILQNLVHELTHAWIGLNTGHWPFPPVIEEGCARAVERMFGFDPPGCHTPGWENPARNLRHVAHDYPFLTIRDLLNFPSADEWKSFDKRLVWSMLWETDALTSYLQNRICDPSGLNGIFNRMRGQWIGTNARLRWIADSCNKSVHEVENGFREYVRLGTWVAYVPIRGTEVLGRTGNA